MNTKYVCINLAKRFDRKAAIEKYNIPFTFFTAVDGSTLEMTNDTLKLFNGNDFQWRTGIMGCALSHLNCWKELSESQYDYYVIVEDDSEFVDNFIEKTESILKQMKEQNASITYIFWHEYKRKYFHIEKLNNENPILKSFDYRKAGGGTGGYIISKEGAKTLFEWFMKNGFKRGVDYAMYDYFDHIKIPVYCSVPKLLRSPEIDTDIQLDLNTLL
jgi:glycosyl transferase family 25